MYLCIYIYICREREISLYIYIYIYMYMHIRGTAFRQPSTVRQTVEDTHRHGFSDARAPRGRRHPGSCRSPTNGGEKSGAEKRNL